MRRRAQKRDKINSDPQHLKMFWVNLEFENSRVSLSSLKATSRLDQLHDYNVARRFHRVQ